MPNECNKDSTESELQMSDDQLLMIAKKTYEHVKVIKKEEEE